MKRSGSLILILMLTLATLALAIRVPHWLQRPLGAYSENEDAAAHVLATVVAYDRVPSSEHNFVPIFTMGAEHDLWIDDLPTASRMSARGYNYYTSWPPGAFVFAWAAHKALGLEPSPASLRGVNLFLQYASAALLFLLGYSLAKRRQCDDATCWVAGAVASAFYIATPEALSSHLFSFWAEQVYQPLLLLQLLAFLRRERWQAVLALCLLGTVGALVDWTAYVAGAGFFLAFAWLYWRERRRYWLLAAGAMALAHVLSAALLLEWVTTKVSLQELLSAQGYRARTRTGALADYAKLLLGYALSLGPLLVALPFARVRVPLKEAWACMPDRPVLFAAAFPALENVLLANHAATYSYDRLKVVSLVGLLLASVIATGLVRIKPLAIATLIGALLSLAAFGVVFSVYRPPDSPMLLQRKQLAELIGRTALADEIAFVNDTVRGHTLYYSGRNIVEIDATQPPAQIEAQVVDMLRRRHFSKGVYFRVDPQFEKVDVVRIGLAGTLSESTLPLAPGG